MAGAQLTPPQGMQALRAGVLSLLAAATIALCGSAWHDVLYQPVRDLPGKWVEGRYQSDPFWITRRASGYRIDLELPDTRVRTEDRPVELPRGEFTQRCGQPFPRGITWSVRHFGRVISQHTSHLAPWCEQGSSEHVLRAEIGGFRAWPGPGYSIQIEAPRAIPGESPPGLPLRMSMRSETGGTSEFALPAALLLSLLVWLGVICIPLGTAAMIMERFKIMEGLEERLERRRVSTIDGPCP